MWTSPLHALNDAVGQLGHQARVWLIRNGHTESRQMDRRWQRMERNPGFEIRLTGDAIELRTKVPGLDMRTLKVILYDNHLTLRGGRLCRTQHGGRPPQIRRIAYHHQVALPADADPINIRATYGGKILRIRLHRAMVEPLGHPHS